MYNCINIDVYNATSQNNSTTLRRRLIKGTSQFPSQGDSAN